jgi:hypothetical protein
MAEFMFVALKDVEAFALSKKFVNERVFSQFSTSF